MSWIPRHSLANSMLPYPYYFSDYSTCLSVYLLVPKPKHMRITQITHPHLIRKAILSFQHTGLCDQGNWIHKLNARQKVTKILSQMKLGMGTRKPLAHRAFGIRDNHTDSPAR